MNEYTMTDTQKQPASVPESVRRLMEYAGKQRREVSNPCITANEAIELANYMVAQSAEIERLKGLYNPELVSAAAHMIVTQRDEIERLKGLLTIYFNAQQEKTK